MGKIINFVNRCGECKHEKEYSCTNIKYKRKSLEILKKGRCPYWEMK